MFTKFIKFKESNVWKNQRPLFKFAAEVPDKEVVHKLSPPVMFSSSDQISSPKITIKMKTSKKKKRKIRKERRRQLTFEKTRKQQIIKISNRVVKNSVPGSTTSGKTF